ncbi:bifunctional apoptosis regulator-like [Ylistrum balloti]|uniref:bifunctional apoptosis regulator-like n=1 Tax=Ylistrum balloti TaxID=509963 RepID=UPI002905B431|nr:bifunctional apoptosis regulator-like [Ylistrum balloti]
MLVEEHGDAECGCCFELLVEPTTLVCGHTFCKHCLARWTVTSGKRQCPTCRVQWRGSPKVNVLLRNLLENTWSQKLAERMQEVNTEENRNVVSKFDNINTFATTQEMFRTLHNSVQAGRADTTQSNQTRCKYFSSGIALTVLVFCTSSFIWNLGKRDLISTPVNQWNTDDTVKWMDQLGPWAGLYTDDIKNNDIDGKFLLVMQENDVINTLHMTNELHRRVFLREIDELRTTGTKPTGNFWEYKSKYPVFTFFLLFGFKLFPRITIGCTYLFQYQTVYSPFMKYACPELSETGMNEATGFWRVFYTLFLPYWGVGRYVYAWSSEHYYISRYVILVCVLATIHDVMWFLSIAMKKWIRKDIEDHVCLYRNVVIVLLLSAVLPWFLYNFLFYDNVVSLVLTYPASIYALSRKLT